MLLIKIHGTSGAGKTTAVRDIMEYATEIAPIGPNPKRPEAYKLAMPGILQPVFVLGPYENTCGGMDGVPTQREQIDLIEKYAALGHVIYEGLLMSTFYGGLGLAMEKYGKDHVWAFLDTPIEICIDRIKQRRLAAGNLKPLNESNTRGRMKPITSLKAKLLRMRANVVDLNYLDQPGDQIMRLIGDNDHA